MDGFKVTQGYVAWLDVAVADDWRACWAHLSSGGLTCYSHQYSKIPMMQYRIVSSTVISEVKLEGIGHSIEITTPQKSIKLALQSRVDLNRWLSAISMLAKQNDGLNHLDDGGKSSTKSDSGSMIALPAEVPDYSDSDDANQTETELPTDEEEIFVIKKKKTRSKRIRNDDSRGSIINLQPDEKAILRDTISRTSGDGPSSEPIVPALFKANNEALVSLLQSQPAPMISPLPFSFKDKVIVSPGRPASKSDPHTSAEREAVAVTEQVLPTDASSSLLESPPVTPNDALPSPIAPIVSPKKAHEETVTSEPVIEPEPVSKQESATELSNKEVNEETETVASLDDPDATYESEGELVIDVDDVPEPTVEEQSTNSTTKKIRKRRSHDRHKDRQSLSRSAQVEPETTVKKLQKVGFSDELTDILATPRKRQSKHQILHPPHPKKGILKKQGVTMQRSRINVADINGKQPRIVRSRRQAFHWIPKQTKFPVTVKNGITYVKNPHFNLKEVELREYLEQMKSNPGDRGDPSILDLSSRELTFVPTIVTKQKHLTVLNLYMNQLKFIPSDIGALTNLVQLGINENLLLELPPSIGLLSSLEILDLRHNRLIELPKEIGNLRSMKRLFLRYNRLEGLPDSLCSLTNLELLSVRNNNLLYLPDNIRKLTKLRVLDAHQNQLMKLPSLRGLTELIDLDVQYNQLSRLPKDISRLKNLRKLHLGHNKLKDFPIEICQLRNIEELDLEGNILTSLSEDICNLTLLQQLYISRNQISALPDNIGQLVNLRQLFANCNRLSEIPACIGKLSELKEIDLGTNNFTVFPDPSIFRHVTTLNIHDNLISELPKNINEMVSIKTLNLGENSLRWLPKSFCLITALTHLRLSCNELDDLPQNLDGLISLRTLQLDNNLFEDLPPQVGFLGNLVSLSLLDNDLNDLPNELINLHKLKQLKVDGNPLECFPPNVSGGAAVFQYLGQRVKESEFGL